MSNDEKFVAAIFKELIEENSVRYRASLSKPVDTGSDVYAKARNALAKLSKDERDNVFKFIDLAIVDSTSVIFGTLDGSHFPDGIDGDIIVDYKGEEIQGSLQDLFIEKAEDRGIYN